MHNSVLSGAVRLRRAMLDQASVLRRPPMIGIHIVCTHDAVKVAETLTRLLEAEEHPVRVSYGRQSIADLQIAKTSQDAVVLIWSANAPSQHYMLEWSRQIPPARLIEIARAPGWPRSTRKAPVIDFATWRGERGGRAWNALTERLQAFEPAKAPSKRAVFAAGFAGMAAVGGVLMIGLNDTNMPMPQPIEPMEQSFAGLEEAPSAGIGGPIDIVEPASIEDLAFRRVTAPHAAPIELSSAELLEISEYRSPDIRDATFMERLVALNPLRDRDAD